MRKYIRDNIVEMIPTIIEGIEYSVESTSQESKIVMKDCYDAVNAIVTNLNTELTKERCSFYYTILEQIKDILLDIDKSTNKKKTLKLSKIANGKLLEIKENLLKEQEIKLEVVFLPYKASMWDSLESIWLAAKEDKRCNCSVIPIPYFDKNKDGSLGEMHYEAEKFPKHVPLVSYEKYNLKERAPDIIYFHNPYDQYNFVTTVHPEFYSKKLKTCTNMLVYVPYYIAGAYKDMEAIKEKNVVTGALYADRVIAQSYKHKEIMTSLGFDNKKVIPLGSPKTDAVINAMKVEPVISDDWKIKLKGKKIFLFNTSIVSMLNRKDYMERFEKMARAIINTKGAGLLWRPHPLLETTIKSMRPELFDKYKELTNEIKNANNAILDETGDSYSSICFSDALISDTSSLLRQYMITGKPILALNLRSDLRDKRICLFDHFSCYFLYDGVKVTDFINMVMNNEDPKKANRLEDLNNSVLNLDGSCGEKIHHRIFNEVHK